MTATILWEVTRRGLIWYYSTLSLVNLIYGSSPPGGGSPHCRSYRTDCLVGAQVIAELEGDAA